MLSFNSLFKYNFKLLIVLLLLSIFTPTVYAQWTTDGDTLFVQTVSPSLSNDSFGTFLFPPDTVRFEKILMYATFSCSNCQPDGGYDWNYPFLAGPNSASAYEIARYETPFGNNPFSEAGGVTWVYDVTDYRPVLHDSTYIQAGSIGAHWRGGPMTLTFVMIKGVPPRDPINVHQVYKGFWDYTYPLIADSLSPKTFTTTTSEKMAKLIVRIIGNGFGDALNCSEFCPRTDSVYVDGTRRFTTYMYRTNCDMDPLAAKTGSNEQQGTWWYSRGEWCPGSNVTNFEYEITPYYTPGNPVTVQLALQYYVWTHLDSTGANPAKYAISSQLVTFGNPNFTLDASITGIIAPNKMTYYSRFNPICGNPIIIIENTGSTALTSATITYGVEGGTTQTYNWTGNLAFLQSDTVTLPTLSSWTGTAKFFTATITNPNGGTDQNPENNSYSSSYSIPPNYTENKLVFELKTNNYGSFYSDTLKDASGNVVFYRPASGSLANSTVYNDTVNLANGCYTYILYSKDPYPTFPEGAFGLACPFYSVGSPYDKIINGSTGATQITFNTWFGKEIWWPFTINDALSVQNVNNTEGLVNIYPNPAKDMVNVNITLPTLQNVTIAVYTILGTKVFQETYKEILSSVVPINLSGNPNGVYIVNIITQNKSISQKIILQR